MTMSSGSEGARRHASSQSGSVSTSEKLQFMYGSLEVKFKTGAFATWSEMFIRLEGRWMVMYRNERETTRLGAIELGPGVTITNIHDHETKFPRRFDIYCQGGILSSSEFNFRTKSRKDCELWVQGITLNLHLLNTVGLNPCYGMTSLEPVLKRMRKGLTFIPIRIRSTLTLRCCTGEEIVTFLVMKHLAKDRTHATQIGRHLLSMNMIHHIVWEKDFTDTSDHYTMTDLETDQSYILEQFQKYMDTRRFWKYFSEDIEESEHSGTSSGSTLRTSASTTISVPSHGIEETIPDKKIKKCGLCGKSFNPLRRRYICRLCSAIICSHCSMSRKVTEGDNGLSVLSSNVSPSEMGRICVSCKLNCMSTQEDFYQHIFDTPIMGGDLDGLSKTSTSRIPLSQRSNRHNSHRRSGSNRDTLQRRKENGTSTQICGFCKNEGCAPIRAVQDVPYPITQVHAETIYWSALTLPNEAERLRSVRMIKRALTTTDLQPMLTQLCAMASIATSCPIVMIGLLDIDHYIICGEFGITTDHQVIREECFAAHTCRQGIALVCSDLDADIRFAANPWRQNVLKASFYAGIPLELSNGHVVGTIEVLDTVPRWGCLDVLKPIHKIVKGILRKFEQIVSTMPEQVVVEEETQEESVLSSEDDDEEYDLSTLEVVERQPFPTPSTSKENQVETVPVSVSSISSVSSSTTPSLAPDVAPVLNDEDMESKLLQLLNQTTTTQEQLRNQQGQMFTAIHTHSEQISQLAKQLERMEHTLTTKLEGS